MLNRFTNVLGKKVIISSNSGGLLIVKQYFSGYIQEEHFNIIFAEIFNNMWRRWGVIMLLSLQFIRANAQDVFSFGPGIHFNFGGGESSWSFNLEGAYWNIANIPYGADFGIEWEKDKFRIYSELQTGIVMGGISAGPFYEWGDDGNRLGLQTSLWANAFVGINLRARFSRDYTRWSPGIYFRILGSPDGSLREVWDENHEEDNDDWDWD